MRQGRISVFVINDEFTSPSAEATRSPFDDFREDVLAGFDAAAYLFPPDTEEWNDERWREELDRAVLAAQASTPDVVLLDVHFGEYGKARLGVHHALPGLLAAGFPVIVFSRLEAGSDIYAQIQRQPGIVRFLPSERLGELAEHIQAVRSFGARAKTEVGLGFGFRDTAAIQQRKEVEEVFERVMTDAHCEAIEVPLVTYVEDFIGPVPRPIASKSSNRLFSSVVPEGRAMAIRYEGTALVSKFVASQLLSNEVRPEQRSWRYSYFQEMVRVEAPEELDSRHFRAFFQAGWEMFTTEAHSLARNTADCLVTALLFARELGLKARVRVSDVRLLETLLNELRVYRKGAAEAVELNKHERRMLVAELEKEPEERDLEAAMRRVGLGEASAAAQLIVEMSRHQECPLAEGIEFVKRVAKGRSSFEDAARDLAAIAEELRHRATEKEVLFDPGVYRSLNFYSGATFQGDLVDDMGVVLFRPDPSGDKKRNLKGREWLGGGVFTGLVESFGVTGPVFSVGAAAGVERLTTWLGRLREEAADA